MAPAFAILGLMVLASAGAAIDYGRLQSVRTKLQAAMDNAVLAAALDTSSNYKQTAASAFTAQLPAGLTPPSSGDYLRNEDGGVTGQVSASVPLSFGGILGLDEATVAITATSKIRGGNKVCILLRGTGSQSLLVNSGASVIAPDCEVHVSSKASPAAIINSSTTLDTRSTCVAGTNVIVNGTRPASLTTGCTTVTDPFAGTLPAPASTTCTFNGRSYDASIVDLSPGVYCGWHNFNAPATVTLSPGLYVIRGGGFNVNGGTWTGNGVTIYFDDTSKIQFNSGTKTNLSAPTGGSRAGILFYERSGLSTSDFILNSASGHNLNGLIYLPSRNLTINGGANGTADKATLVLNNLILNAASWSLSPASTSIQASGGTEALYLSQ